MNWKVLGLPSPICVAHTTKIQCAHCDEVNATSQNYPAASETVLTPTTELWQWDMLDMGANYATINGNRYATLFLIKHT
eukprot:3190213-Rhodomonas_salina.2